MRSISARVIALVEHEARAHTEHTDGVRRLVDHLLLERVQVIIGSRKYVSHGLLLDYFHSVKQLPAVRY